MTDEPKQEQESTEKFEERKPILRTKMRRSNDGKWLIIETIRTDIVHANYIQKILNR